MAALILGLPAAATAGTASLGGSTLTYSAASGESNDLSIEPDGSIFRVIDNTVPVTAGAGCTQRTVHRVTCPTAGVTLLDVLARDQDDTVQTSGSTDAAINGGAGLDELTSDSGNDTLSAGKGEGSASSGENLVAGAGEDTLNGSPVSNTFTNMNGGPGNDDLLGGPGGEGLFGDTGSDFLRGGGGFDSVQWAGSAGITVTMGAGANDGEPGENDNVAADIEQVFGTGLADTLIGAAGNDSLNSFGGADTLEGGDGDDFLDAGTEADTLTGDNGDDFLVGGTGADDHLGGPGTDTASYNNDFSRSAPVTVTINGVANDGDAGEGDNVRTSVENVIGTSFADMLTGSSGDNRLDGVGGNDIINGGNGEDRLWGDFQFQTGASGSDTIDGGAGDDRLFGGGGADDLKGGTEFDFVDYSPFAFGSTPLVITIDNVANDGEAGENDNVRPSIEGVVGGAGDDNITGSSFANTLFGGRGLDNLSGGDGDDLMDGDQCCTFFADVLDGGPGSDTVTYRSHNGFPLIVDIDGVADDGAFSGAEGDNVMATVENLIGGDAGDTLTGTDSANSIVGRGGNDILTAAIGADFLSGGTGSDTHNAGAGSDEINSKDGQIDTDNCGAGSDSVTADAFDTLNEC